MTDKAKKIFKFILTIGIVLSAVAAVFAVAIRTQKKLAAVTKDEDDDTSECGGSCAECGMCECDDDEEEETEE